MLHLFFERGGRFSIRANTRLYAKDKIESTDYEVLTSYGQAQALTEDHRRQVACRGSDRQANAELATTRCHGVVGASSTRPIERSAGCIASSSGSSLVRPGQLNERSRLWRVARVRSKSIVGQKVSTNEGTKVGRRMMPGTKDSCGTTTFCVGDNV